MKPAFEPVKRHNSTTGCHLGSFHFPHKIEHPTNVRQGSQRHKVIHLAAMSAVMRAKRAFSSALLMAGISSEARLTDFEASVSRSRHSCMVALNQMDDDELLYAMHMKCHLHQIC